MFNAANGAEDWAFFPKELTKVFKARKDDLLGGNKVWGVDAPVVSYRFDANQDGSIKATDGDKMYIFFGLRRGGRAMYAMDVTDPANPTFLWRISNATAGFSELGQTWSVPVVTTVPGYVNASGVRLPVLIFGGGYDSVYDKAPLATVSQDLTAAQLAEKIADINSADSYDCSVFAFLSEVSPTLQQSFIDEMGVSKDAVAEVARKFSDLAGYKLPLAI